MAQHLSSEAVKLNREETLWLIPWLEKWGAWIYSGRIDRRQSSVIAGFMAQAAGVSGTGRPLCNDDEGILINGVIDELHHINKQAWSLLICRYAFCASERKLAGYYQSICEPRLMSAVQGKPKYRVPSLATCRREVNEMFSAMESFIYVRLQAALSK
ncbi:DUF1133 family protein [Paramixta manurensis]|uniref:DUF1133 family protein n=1 Tax=Paramixta manurensis TaxID=2740817 RepID=A0A6M8U7R8_9GAMM|nr:DUF1133 family protein [Erwiniaceae bacterium PD-1]